MNASFRSGDKIVAFSMSDISFLSNDLILGTLNGNKYFLKDKDKLDNKCLEPIFNLHSYINSRSEKTIFNLNSLFKSLKKLRLEILEKESIEKRQSSFNHEDNFLKDKKIDCQVPKIFQSNPNLLSKIIDKVVIVSGDLNQSGIHLINSPKDKNNLLNFVGYSKGEIEVSSDFKRIDILNDKIELTGDGVKNTLSSSLASSNNLSDILRSKNLFNDDAYPFFGIIKRLDNNSFIPSLITFSPEGIISNRDDYKLINGDKVIIFSDKEINQAIQLIFNLEKGFSFLKMKLKVKTIF